MDRKGRNYVSTIEGRFYPFYGVQWHPERSSAMDYFAKFFVNELKKNRTKNKKLFFVITQIKNDKKTNYKL